MKISELIALLEQRKEEYGDVDVRVYNCGDYLPVDCVDIISVNDVEYGVEIC